MRSAQFGGVQVLEALNSSEVLGKNLFQVNFLTTLTNEALVTMLYHKQLDETWRQQATELKNRFARLSGRHLVLMSGVGARRLDCHIVGRARKQQLHVDQNHVIEKLNVNGKQLVYKQVRSASCCG